MDENESQQLYLEYRLVSEQIRKMQEYLEQSRENLGEVENIIGAIDGLGSLRTGDRIFAPIANGIFIEASLQNTEVLRLNVGGKIVVGKSISEAKELLRGQRQELLSLQTRAHEEFLKLKSRSSQIEASIGEGANNETRPEQ
jgi:prefoldin alpha subunit